jgi:IstB-like ATP binding protein
MRFWNGPQLLIIDELGYLPLPAEAAAHLFQVVSRRYEARLDHPHHQPRHRQLEFDDTIVAAAILDQLLHTAPSSRSTGPATGCAATTNASRLSAPASRQPERPSNESRPILAGLQSPLNASQASDDFGKGRIVQSGALAPLSADSGALR